MAADAPVTNRRSFLRAKAPILCVPVGALSEGARRVNDISVGGLRVYSDEAQQIGTRLEIELFFPDASSATVTVEVVWVEKLEVGQPAKFDLGLRYIDARPEDLARIAEVVEAE